MKILNKGAEESALKGNSSKSVKTININIIVMYNNHRYYIKGRRSNGSFTLVSLEGLKDEDRTYKKLTLLAHTNAYLIKLKEKN